MEDAHRVGSYLVPIIGVRGYLDDEKVAELGQHVHLTDLIPNQKLPATFAVSSSAADLTLKKNGKRLSKVGAAIAADTVVVFRGTIIRELIYSACPLQGRTNVHDFGRLQPPQTTTKVERCSAGMVLFWSYYINIVRRATRKGLPNARNEILSDATIASIAFCG